jgi:uncharacterized protein with beta-barrel porin domain
VSKSLLDPRTRALKSSASRRVSGAVGALAVFIGFTAATVSPARADGGSGGTGDGGCVGAAGGTGIAGNGGGLGGACNSGGGGGAAGGGFGGPSIGPFGGTGGDGGNHGAVTGTLSNLSPLSGGNGAAGTDGIFAPSNAGGGGGGGAGGAGAVVTGITGSNSSSITGGLGGKGGDGSAGGIGGGGGSGGDGGAGLIFTGTPTATNALTGTISGGRGGDGGAGSGAGVGGNGGAGGIGVQFLGGGTLTNTGAIFGGNGGIAGSNGVTPTAGAGGAGVVGSGLSIVNSGTISGGTGGDGVTRADAISFTGGTNSLILSSGGIIGALTGGVGVSGSLSIDPGTTAGNNVTLGSVIHDGSNGAGSLTKLGGGTLTLSAANTYTGTTSVNAGTLTVDGSIATSSMTTVASGATLNGNGIVGNTTINAGGVFAPGSGTPGASMTVNGSLALASGAFYSVGLNPSTASFANVTGTATLGGATLNATFASGSYISKQYTLVTAASVSGAFGSLVNVNMSSNLSDSLSYDATHAYLDLKLDFGIPSNLNGNQQGVGNTLTKFFNTTGGIAMAFAALTPSGLTQISGETATASQQTTFDAMTQFMGLMTDPFMNRGGGTNATPGASGYADEANAYAATKKTDAFAMFTKAPSQSFEQRWSVWGAGFGGSQATSGNAAVGSNNTTSSVYGTAVGADYVFSPNTIAGFALAGGGTNFSVADGGSGRSDMFQFGANVRHNEGPAYISAALAYGWQDITTNRTVTAAGTDMLRAEFNANAWSGRVEGGYRFVSPATAGVGITPYAGAQFVTFDLPAYAEAAIAGANTFALGYGARSVTDPRSELGIRTDKSWLVNDGVLTLRGRFAWSHDYEPDRSIAATFQALPGSSFVVNGAAQASDSALTSASIEMKWRNGWSVAGTFDGEFSNVTSSYAGKGVVRYQW